MVDRFFGQQRTPKELFHDVSVFKNVSNGFTVSRRNTQNGIAAFNAPGDLWQAMLGPIYLAHPFVFALPRAKGLLLVNATAAATSFVEWIATVFACSDVFSIGVRLASDGRTRDRAIHRVFTKFLTVFRQIGGLVRKGVPAGFAGELHGWHLYRGASVDSFMGLPACPSAKPGVGGMGRFDQKGYAAVVANFLNACRFWHVVTPWFGNQEYGMPTAIYASNIAR
jgi:hypothetical protein